MSWVFFKAPTVAIGITSSWKELLLESNPFKPALLRSRNVPNRNPLVRSALIPLGTWKAVMMKPHVPCRASISKNDKYVIKKLDYIDILQHFSISDSGTFAFGESHISWTPWFSNDEKNGGRQNGFPVLELLPSQLAGLLELLPSPNDVISWKTPSNWLKKHSGWNWVRSSTEKKGLSCNRSGRHGFQLRSTSNI